MSHGGCVAEVALWVGNAFQVSGGKTSLGKLAGLFRTGFSHEHECAFQVICRGNSMRAHSMLYLPLDSAPKTLECKIASANQNGQRERERERDVTSLVSRIKITLVLFPGYVPNMPCYEHK